MIISWNIPQKNSDGSPLRDLAGFKIYRGKIDDSCLGCPTDLPLYRDIDLEAPGGTLVEKEKITFMDRGITQGERYGYKVAAYNKLGYFGEFSAVMSAEWLSPPPPPGGLEGIPGDGSATLQWTPYAKRDEDDNFFGYRVYRSRRSGTYNNAPVNDEPLTKEFFTDTGLANNEPYYYIVRSAVKAGETITEGAPSAEILIIPVDKMPPSIPEGLTLIDTGDAVSVSWIPVSDEDLLGYNVYRKRWKETAMKRINTAPLETAYYSDRNVARGESYLYAVTAVDNSPQKNESALSREVLIELRE